ncbi:MAG: OadG family protein [Lachnospiraceae bacterium]|nr:OadG family protein [Lachnospiraceae bacterium]
MKKRIALALGMIMMILMLGACGTDPTTVDYNGSSYDDLQLDMDTNVSLVQGLTDLFAENDMDPKDLPDGVADQLIATYGVTEAQIEASAKWQDILDEFGDLKEASDDTFTVTKSGNTLTTDMTLKMEKKDVNFEVVYDYYSMEITGISVDPIYTLSEKMSKAGINTLISMGIVFLVLILISLLIACFNIFPYLEKKKQQKKLAAASATEEAGQKEETAAAAVTASTPQTDDTELIAVIAAAIAASTGTSTSDFVVRSINRR